MGRYIGAFLCLLFTASAMAADQLPGTKHFMIKDTGSPVNFLSWIQYNTPAPKPTEKYVRLKHFGIWIDFPHDNSCLTTRGLVLERDTKAPLKFVVFDPPDPSKPPPPPIFPNACYVAEGLWYDSYTDSEYNDAKVVEIDHIVPLKQAWLSGAYDWPWRKRCAYFNFLGNPNHLKAVQDKANSAKLDKSPDRWMPANKKYRCQYLADWLRVKTIWQLRMGEAEAAAIQEMVADFKCNPDAFKMSQAELAKQRKIAVEIGNECPADLPKLKPSSEKAEGKSL